MPEPKQNTDQDSPNNGVYKNKTYEMPKRRQSIHGTNDDGVDNEELCRCVKCNNFFLVKNEKNQQKLSPEDAEKWCELKKKETDIHPNLEEVKYFLCEGCEPPKIATPAPAIQSTQLTCLRTLAVIVVAVFISIYYKQIQNFLKDVLRTPVPTKVYNQTEAEMLFDSEFYGLENVYTNQDEEVWFTFAAGIKSVQKNNQPSVFLMLYESDSAGQTAKCLAQDVVKPATKYFMKEENKALVFSGNELKTKDLLEDPGNLLEKFKDPVSRAGAMVVTNLQDVPIKVAKNFHFVCDKYSPWVEKAVFFFTLKVNQFTSSTLQKEAENRLTELWMELPDNLLQPLITRITANVLRIESDYSSC